MYVCFPPCRIKSGMTDCLRFVSFTAAPTEITEDDSPRGLCDLWRSSRNSFPVEFNGDRHRHGDAVVNRRVLPGHPDQFLLLIFGNIRLNSSILPFLVS